MSPSKIEHVISGYEKVLRWLLFGCLIKFAVKFPRLLWPYMKNTSCSEEEIKDFTVCRDCLITKYPDILNSAGNYRMEIHGKGEKKGAEVIDFKSDNVQ